MGEFEDRLIEIIHSEEQKQANNKKIEKKVQSFRDVMRF